MKLSITKFQWAQLIGLSFIHIVVDSSPGMLPAILPAIRQRFDFSLTQGFALVTTLYISCNLFQILLGHIRSDKKIPVMLPLGTILACVICLIGLIPNFSLSFYLLLIIMVISGFGVGVVHPESLRALHRLRRIRSAIGTAFYLNCGYVGFVLGAFLSAALVYHLGLNGLLLFFVPAAVSVFIIIKLRTSLSIERPQKNSVPYSGRQVSFWLLFLIAVPVATSSTLLPAMLPEALNELGFELYYGGMPAMLIGIGSIFGSMICAWFAERWGYLKVCCISAFFAVPFTIAYMFLLNKIIAILLLLGTGFGAQGAYTLLVSMARHSKGMVLGRRMGWIVGGVWGTAALVLLATGHIAEKTGLRAVLHFTPYGYLISAVIALVLLIKKN